MPRLILIPLVLILLLVLATAVLLPLLVDKEALLEMAAKAVHEQTGATLTVAGDTGLSLFPTLGMSLSDVAITLPEKQQPDLRIRSVDIAVQLVPLFSGKVEIDAISLDGLVVRIESAVAEAGGAAGRADIAADAGAALVVPLALRVKQLLVTDARFEAAEGPLFELVKLQADNLNLEQQPIGIELNARRPGEQPVDITLSGTIRVDQQAQQIKLDEVTAVISGATAEPIKLQTTGSVDIASEVGDLLLTLESGETRGRGSVRYASAESPRIDAHLQLNLFDPALLALAGPEAAAAAGKESRAAGPDEPLPLDALRLIDTQAVLDIEVARFGDHSVNNLHVSVRALHGLIQASELTGNLHGGELVAGATLDARDDTATLETSGSLSRLDIATALAATKSDPVLTGSATLNWQLNSRGLTHDALTAALTGPVNLTTEEVVLQGTSVEKLLCEVVALTNKEQLATNFPDNTRFELLNADIQLADGRATLNPLRAELPGIVLSGNGNLDLLSQEFKATFKGRLSSELEQLDHACRVSKRLIAIDWPVKCKGNVATDPAGWCRVDSDKILQDLMVNEGREKLGKKATKFFNKLFNKDD